ncbi:MAG: hypothetical protein IC227_11380 [Enterococcus lacertideformus]|uniref:Uncharacterized protein n=1 Tax=Enterococcus lacertideformus TaxID=2771493 RepID=A0A931FBR0_9ENTE|nr:hypothetical protein [Enterococcus lacertideformus]
MESNNDIIKDNNSSLTDHAINVIIGTFDEKERNILLKVIKEKNDLVGEDKKEGTKEAAAKEFLLEILKLSTTSVNIASTMNNLVREKKELELKIKLLTEAPGKSPEAIKELSEEVNAGLVEAKDAATRKIEELSQLTNSLPELSKNPEKAFQPGGMESATHLSNIRIAIARHHLNGNQEIVNNLSKEIDALKQKLTQLKKHVHTKHMELTSATDGDRASASVESSDMAKVLEIVNKEMEPIPKPPVSLSNSKVDSKDDKSLSEVDPISGNSRPKLNRNGKEDEKPYESPDGSSILRGKLYENNQENITLLSKEPDKNSFLKIDRDSNDQLVPPQVESNESSNQQTKTEEILNKETHTSTANKVSEETKVAIINNLQAKSAVLTEEIRLQNELLNLGPLDNFFLDPTKKQSKQLEKKLLEVKTILAGTPQLLEKVNEILENKEENIDDKLLKVKFILDENMQLLKKENVILGKEESYELANKNIQLLEKANEILGNEEKFELAKNIQLLDKVNKILGNEEKLNEYIEKTKPKDEKEFADIKRHTAELEEKVKELKATDHKDLKNRWYKMFSRPSTYVFLGRQALWFAPMIFLNAIPSYVQSVMPRVSFADQGAQVINSVKTLLIGSYVGQKVLNAVSKIIPKITEKVTTGFKNKFPNATKKIEKAFSPVMYVGNKVKQGLQIAKEKTITPVVKKVKQVLPFGHSETLTLEQKERRSNGLDPYTGEKLPFGTRLKNKTQDFLKSAGKRIWNNKFSLALTISMMVALTFAGGGFLGAAFPALAGSVVGSAVLAAASAFISCWAMILVDKLILKPIQNKLSNRENKNREQLIMEKFKEDKEKGQHVSLGNLFKELVSSITKNENHEQTINQVQTINQEQINTRKATRQRGSISSNDQVNASMPFSVEVHEGERQQQRRKGPERFAKLTENAIGQSTSNMRKDVARQTQSKSSKGPIAEEIS